MYSEIRAIVEFLPGVELKKFGRGCFIVREPKPEDFEAAGKVLEKVWKPARVSNTERVLGFFGIKFHFFLFFMESYSIFPYFARKLHVY